MEPVLPSRLLALHHDRFFVFDPRPHPRRENVERFDIVSYRWGEPAQAYDCGIDGVAWEVTISLQKIGDIQRLMRSAHAPYLWVDCLCINQSDKKEKAAEIAKMHSYYKMASKCHVLIDMVEPWEPQRIVKDLSVVNHVVSAMSGAALASEAVTLSKTVANDLGHWANQTWAFPLAESTVQLAAIDRGVVNCYATCVDRVRRLFANLYFSRVWTFQEMLLGKEINMWGINDRAISNIGDFGSWVNLATEATDKAYKIRDWIDKSCVVKSDLVKAVLNVLALDILSLEALRTQVCGIDSARTDILAGGADWWVGNSKGVSNVFSAISIQPRECQEKADIFKGLLGVFSGLFTPDEIESQMTGQDMNAISFAFFRQLSVKTKVAWTRLVLSSGKREAWGWIPVLGPHNRPMTTDCFAGVVRLGRLVHRGPRALASPYAMTGIRGLPRPYMEVRLRHEPDRGCRFEFRGCNVGKTIKTGFWGREPIPGHGPCRTVVTDATGRTMVQCATILAFLMDPGQDAVRYRRRLLGRLQPKWRTTDANAKPDRWEDRCVDGHLEWECPVDFRVHNRSVDYKMVDVTGYGSRLHNDSTADLVCEVRVNCGCTLTAPFCMVLEGITAVQGSFLGRASASLDPSGRIALSDGLGLVQVGDAGQAFRLVAFAGDVRAHRWYAARCRNTKFGEIANAKLQWPTGRVLVPQDFRHGMTAILRNYGYVKTGGSGNLLIFRNHPLAYYKVAGVCIDDNIPSKKSQQVLIE